MEIFSFHPRYSQDLLDMMQDLRRHIVFLETWDDDMFEEDVTPWVNNLIEAYAQWDTQIFLAKMSDTIVWCIVWNIEHAPDPWSKIQKYGNIENFYVKPDFRGSGIGGRLMDEMGSWFRSQGATHMSVSIFAPNDRARKFYERYGFEPRMITLARRLSA